MKRRAFLAALLCAALGGGGCSRPRAPAGDGPRIVSLAPSLTEIICALGAADTLAGRTSVCNYPPDALAAVPIVGDFGAPSLEKLLSVRPTCVLEVDLADETTGREIDRLGIQRERIPCSRLEDIPAAILAVGRRVRRDEAAAALAGKLSGEIARLRAQAAAATNVPGVFAEIWGDPLMTAGANSFVSELIALAGGRNIGDEAAKDYFQVSSEWVVARDPEVVVCLYMSASGASRRQILGRPGWAAIRAVREDRIVEGLNPDVLLRPGPRVLDGVAALRAAIQGGKR
jgi:iron complex transport system substrate-binding protein